MRETTFRQDSNDAAHFVSAELLPVGFALVAACHAGNGRRDYLAALRSSCRIPRELDVTLYMDTHQDNVSV
jgi:hypothetical protein